MKLEQDQQAKEQTEIHAQQQIKEKKKEYIVQTKRGLTVFRFNYLTRIIDVAPITQKYDVVRKCTIKTIVFEDGYAYRQALNPENAMRKFVKLIKKVIEDAGKDKN